MNLRFRYFTVLNMRALPAWTTSYLMKDYKSTCRRISICLLAAENPSSPTSNDVSANAITVAVPSSIGETAIRHALDQIFLILSPESSCLCSPAPEMLLRTTFGANSSEHSRGLDTQIAESLRRTLTAGRETPREQKVRKKRC